MGLHRGSRSQARAAKIRPSGRLEGLGPLLEIAVGPAER